MKFLATTCLFLLLINLLGYAQKPELVVPIGHTDEVNTVAFSPDGQYALSGSKDKTLKLWEVSTGRLLRSFVGNADEVYAVAFSPDGRYALSGSRSLKLWEVSTGRLLRSFEGNTDWVNAVAFSPDGRYALSGSGDMTLKLWEVSTGKILRSFVGHTRDVIAVAFSPDGRCILSGSWDKTLKLWEVSTGRLLRSFEGNTDWVNAVAFSPDGRYALLGSRDKTLKLWEVSTGRLLRSFVGNTDVVKAIVFSPNGRYALSGSWDKTLKLWEVSTGRLLRSFEGNTSVVYTVAFSPDGRYALSGSRDKTLKLWEVSTGRLLRSFVGHTDVVNAVAYSPNGRYALLGSRDKTLKLWEVSTGKILHSLEEHTDWVNAVAFSPDGQYALSGSKDKTLKLWEVSTGRLLRSFVGNADDGNAVAFSPDGQYALSGSISLKLWEVSTGRLLRSFVGHTDDVNAVAFSPDGQYALSGSVDRTLKLWEVSTGRLLRSFVGNTEWIYAVAFSPDGQYALLGSGDMTLKLWEVSTGKILRSFEGNTDVVFTVAFSPDGRYALSGYGDKTLKLWEVSTGKILRSLEGHTDWVSTVAFSPDGHYGLSGSADNTSKIWNTATGQELATLIAVDSTDWIITTPSGLFDASPGAMKLMHYVVNDSTDHDEPWKVIELEQLKQRYYQPNLLPILMGFKNEPLRQVPAFEGVTLPPNVRLALHSDTLAIDLQNRKGGIGKVTIFINGAEIVPDLRNNPRQDSSRTTLSLSLPLARFANRFDTLNQITVVAYNAQGWLSGRPQTVEFRPTSQQKGVKVDKNRSDSLRRDTRLRAVVVGTSNVGLRFAHKDAEQIALSLSLVAGELLGPANTAVKLLTTQPGVSQQVTGSSSAKADIVKALVEGQQTRPQDVFVLYLSGHGVNYGGQDGDFYYLTAGATSADAAYLNDPAIRQTYALSSEELTQLLNLIPARKKLLILDVCAAGKGAERLVLAARDVPASQIRAMDKLQSRTGFYVLAGSAADAVSYESNVYGQGLLTYALLQGIRGAALRREGAEEFVDVERLLNHAVEAVPQLAKEIKGIQQPFYRAASEQRSFDIGRVTAQVRQQIHLAEPKPVLLVESFQEETRLRDVLDLRSQVESELIDLTSKGREAPVIYLEAKDYPGAYSLAGRYKLEAESVVVTCTVFRGDHEVGKLVVKGTRQKPAEMAKALIAQAQQTILPKRGNK